MAPRRLVAGVASVVDGFVVAFLDVDGAARRVPLAAAVEVAFEDAPPVRPFPSYRASGTIRAVAVGDYRSACRV
jgi:hypothetical protein